MPAQQKSDATEGSGVLVAPWWIDYFTFEMWIRHYVRSCDETIPEALPKI